MATKPTDTGPWATDTNYPAGPEVEAGSPTKVLPDEEDTVGWRPAQKPPAQKLNRWQNLIYQWMQYLSDGDLTGGVSVAGGLDTDDLAVADDATIGDQLEVIGSLIGSAGAPVNLSASAKGPRFYHTTALALKVPAAMSIEFGTPAHTRAGSGGRWLVGATAATQIVYPVSLPNGARIVSWELYIDKTSSGTAHAQMFRQHDDANTSAAVGVDQTINTTPGQTFFSETMNHDVSASHSYFLVFTPSGNANDKLGHAVIYWTLPPP